MLKKNNVKKKSSEKTSEKKKKPSKKTSEKTLEKKSESLNSYLMSPSPNFNNKKIDTRNNLILESEYLNFINSNFSSKKYKCFIQHLNNYYKLYNYNFPSIDSNNQFNYYISVCFKKNEISHINRLILLLSNFLQLDNTFSLITMIKNGSITMDSEVYNFIKSKSSKSIPSKKNINIYSTCSKLDFGFERISEKIQDKYITVNNNFNYLDFGCGNGKKTLKFQSLFEINIKNTYGVDIENWGPYEKNRKFLFNFQTLGKNNKIPHKENTFDLVTCFLCLHHIPNLMETLKEIKRVLKPSGKLLILEHNAFIDLDIILLDMQHNLFTHIYNEPNKQIYNRFFNILEWDFVLHKIGFKYLMAETYKEQFMQEKYDFQFFAIYLNIK